jgi:hypothetical protein
MKFSKHKQVIWGTIQSQDWFIGNLLIVRETNGETLSMSNV